MKTCLLCERPLPDVPWWKRLASRPPFHDVDGPDSEDCWVAFNRRVGINNPGPKPTRREAVHWRKRT